MEYKTKTFINGTIALFKAIPMSAFKREAHMVSAYDCASHGFMVITKGGNLVNEIPCEMFDIIDSHYGTDVAAFNMTFHKSFGRVANMDPRQYFMEQFLHYLTTYGAESFGVKMIPYVPVEDLEIPGINFNVKKLTIITACEPFEIDDLINNYALNTVSPSPRHIELFKPLMEHLTIDTNLIRSFELQVIKHDMDGTFPRTPITALRYLIYKTTGSTLIIKNRTTRRAIELCGKDPKRKAEAIRIMSNVPYYTWGTIFLRYKPIFLAYKHAVPELSHCINRIRRAAKDVHQPLGDVCVQNVTKLIAENRIKAVEQVVDNASNRDLIKLINALGYRLATYSDTVPQAFSIRNGRTFVKSEGYRASNDTYTRIYNTLVYIENVLANRLHDVFTGKAFYIPDYINYAAPVTEKQFVGNLPFGTTVHAPENGAFVAGIQWYDQKMRTDLDLHMNSAAEHFGWNGGYKSGKRITYTGDQTAAPKPRGAAEGFYFEPDHDDKFILSVNKFCGAQDTEFKFAIAQEKPSEDDIRNRNFTFRNPIFAPIPMKFTDNSAITLGMFVGRLFYVYGGSLTNGIVPSENYKDYVDAIAARLTYQMSLEELIYGCGGTVIHTIRDDMTEEERATVVDLSPEAITATTLLDIVDGNI